MKSKRLIAFTLIELLVVIAIVGILSGFVLVSLNSATNQATDARRKSDLSQIVKALLVYNTSNPTYPIETCAIGSTCSSAVNDALGSAASITGPNNTYYTYSSDDGTSFTVSAIMSNTNTYTYDSETVYSESLTEQVLPGYAKRQPITINSASALTDYQVKLTVAYDTDMQPDFDDLRFTSSNGITELSYWLESKTDSTTATIWVKIPSLASGDNTIYMYYANASATTASNGDNTFEFFDHFLGTTLDTNKWSFFEMQGTVNVSNSILTYSSPSAAQKFLVAETSQSPSAVTEWYARVNSDSNYWAIGTWAITYINHYVEAGYFGGMKWIAYNSDTYTSVITRSQSLSSYTRLTIVWDSSVNLLKLYTNGTLRQSYASPYVTSQPQRPHIRVNNNTVFADWVLVRKYAATEPTSSFSAEQNN